MYNLNDTGIIQNKFALLNSGDYLMNLEDVKEIIEACEKYLTVWEQAEIDCYNENLLSYRELEHQDTTKYKQRLKDQKKAREEKRALKKSFKIKEAFLQIKYRR